MTYRIQTSLDENGVTLALSGQLDHEGISELRRLFDYHGNRHQLILDLNDVSLVQREAIGSLRLFERLGIRLINSPAYVRDWMSNERQTSEPI